MRWASSRGTRTMNNVYDVDWITTADVPLSKV